MASMETESADGDSSQCLQLSGMGPRRAWDLCSRLGSPLGREELRWDSRMRGLRREPLAPRQRSRGVPGLIISFAASAECGRTEGPCRAGRLHESCECFLGSELRGTGEEIMV